jgi:sugar O-acyltransferase (sialic acid O-acetyltransferase NeuD family)
MMKQPKVFLYGAGGHGKVILEILEASRVKVSGIFDDHPLGEYFLDYPLLGGYGPEKLAPWDSLIFAIGKNATRKRLAETLANPFVTAIHPSVIISSRAAIGEGTVVMAGVAINSCAQIGRHAIINTNCSIDHDCRIEDYVHVSPGASLAGDVTVGEGAHVGIGASVIQGIRIGKWATIGAGAVIIRDVPDGAVVVGNPGKVIKYNYSEEKTLKLTI